MWMEWDREKERGAGERKEEKSRISSKRSLFRGCDYRCLSGSRVSTRSSFSPRPSICLALQTSRSIIPRLRCNEISREILGTRRHTARTPPGRGEPSIVAGRGTRAVVRVYETHRKDWPRSRNNYPEGLAFILNYTMCRVYYCDLRWLTEKGYGETGIKGTKETPGMSVLHTRRNERNLGRWVMTLICRFQVIRIRKRARRRAMTLTFLSSSSALSLLPVLTVIFDEFAFKFCGYSPPKTVTLLSVCTQHTECLWQQRVVPLTSRCRDFFLLVPNLCRI